MKNEKNARFAVSTLLRQLAWQGASRGPEWLLKGAPVAVGTIAWVLRGAHRHGVRANLRDILGERAWYREKKDELTTFISFARSFAEGMAAFGGRTDDVAIRISPPDSPQSHRLLSKKGAILVTGHMSGFELAGSILHKKHGVQMVMVMRGEPNAQARAISDMARSMGGLEIVHVGDDPLSSLELVRRLRKGAVVGMQIDRSPKSMRSIDVTLFGKTRSMPAGPFLLSAATQVPIVPVFTRRTGFFQVDISVFDAIQISKKPTDEELSQAAQKVASIFEKWVTSYPTDWFDWGQTASVH